MLLTLPGCTTAVYHPTKSEAEMQVDVSACTDHAHRKYWMDAVAALYEAYDCLEKLGYAKGGKGLAKQVEQAQSQKLPSPARPSEPCRVPCR